MEQALEDKLNTLNSLIQKQHTDQIKQHITYSLSDELLSSTTEQTHSITHHHDFVQLRQHFFDRLTEVKQKSPSLFSSNRTVCGFKKPQKINRQEIKLSSKGAKIHNGILELNGKSYKINDLTAVQYGDGEKHRMILEWRLKDCVELQFENGEEMRKVDRAVFMAWKDERIKRGYFQGEFEKESQMICTQKEKDKKAVRTMLEGFHFLKQKKLKFIKLQDNLQELSYVQVPNQKNKEPRKSLPLRGLKGRHLSALQISLTNGKKEKKFKALTEKDAAAFIQGLTQCLRILF